ncbi:MAG TPA: glycosyltransferase family 4 protein [Candidatus Acidoferrum sp.]|nr:glycosyltransferase family 4 protein [Candidatus Acidoferrum sp.]
MDRAPGAGRDGGMKIAVVGGYARSLVTFRGDMLRSMIELGHEVVAMAPEDNPAVAEALRELGVGYQAVPMRRTGMNPVRDAMTVIALTRAFRAQRPDAVFVYTVKPVIYGSLAALLARVPLRVAMITGTGSAFSSRSSRRLQLVSWLVRRLYRLGLARVHLVFFQNPDDERLFRSLGIVGRRGQRIVRIGGSGVNLVRFEVARLPSGPITFLMIARLIRDKGVAEYVEAARRVRLQRPDVRFLLVGPLDPNPSAFNQADVDAWVASGVVEYLGSTQDVRPFIAEATIYVLPSYGEGMPRSVLEAMAMGRPIVTTDVPGCRETVVPGRNGMLVPVRDAVALADALLQLIASDRLAEMGAESRRLAEERFDVRVVNRTIVEAMGLVSTGSSSGLSEGAANE